MRLFTAIVFDKDTESHLYEIVEGLRAMSHAGTFTDRGNLHLTLNFIGETYREEEVRQAMDHAVSRLKASSFTLSIQGLGRFGRKEGDIWWVGVEKREALSRLQKELVSELKEAGFLDVDDREYKPHLTLGRRVRLQEGFRPDLFEAKIKPMEMQVGRISLMKSERLKGKLVYTEIYHVSLED